MSSAVSLRVILKAGDVTVAESDDPQLWQDVFKVIRSTAHLQARGAGRASEETPSALLQAALASAETGAAAEEAAATPTERLARRLGVSTSTVEAAYHPSKAAPFLRLDAGCFAALKRATPARGANAISSIALAATLLALWAEEAGLEPPTPTQAQAVLDPLNRKDRNPERGLANCAWLRFGGGRITLKTEYASRAEALARAFCKKEAPRL